MITIEKKLLTDYTFIDLFAGLGGFRIALESLGAKCVYSNEWDVPVQKVYEENFGDTPEGDITQVDENTIPDHDILCAGFPCQAFSISGKQRGFEDSRGTLFFDVARIVKAKKPKVVFMENVKNFATHDDGKTLEVVKVAAYCRVSTDSDEQATSYDAQVTHYTEFIRKNPEWEFAGIYADDGISGTNTKKREEFNRMIEDTMAGKIDMIITKSISRFARNTLDCLKYIRQLKEKNVPVFFEKENINTMDSKGEVLLTIMASLAQQESESLSKNVKMGIQFRYQNGEVQVNHNWFLGYTKDENGHLIIDEDQAVVVRRIFREYLQGASLKTIADGLMADGIPTATGNMKWRGDGIRKILTNEKYMGDALLQKTYTVDVLTKKRVSNNGIVPQYYVENNHEAIIPRQLFMQVQEELLRRAHLKTENGKTKRVYSSKYALSSIVYCGKCGDLFRRVAWKARGASYNKWRCASRIEKGPKEGCDADAISETEIQNAVVRAINKTLGGREQFLVQLQHNIEDVLNGDSTATLEYIDIRMAELQEKLVLCVNKNAEYDVIANEIDALREKKAAVVTRDAEQEMLKKRIEEMRQFLQTQSSRVTEYDEQMVRRLIEKITVFDDKLIFEFKSGMSIELKR